jgi:putative transposase
MGRVKRWKVGSMKKRWVAAGMLEAERSFRRIERSFRRIKGHAEMPTLVTAIRRQVAQRAAADDIAENVAPPKYDQEAA